MNEILIANLTLDTYRKNNVPPLIVPQGDYGARVIRVTITEQGKPVSVGSTAAVSIVATRSGDGESLAFSGKANEDGTVTVPVTQWMLDIPDDDVICHVVVTGNGYQYSTTSFLIEPQEKANPTEITPDDPRVDVVTQVLANENARQAAEATRETNEQTRKTAEDARQSAETQRLTDEATRITNEAQRVSAETSRDATFKSWANDIALLPDMSARISRNSKRIDGLEQRINPSPFVFDETVAYQKDVPSNAVGAAAIHEIGGMTYKSKNLIPFPFADGSKTTNGITFTDNGDGSLTINGTAAVDLSYVIINKTIEKGTYTLSIVNGITIGGVVLYLYASGLSNIDLIGNNNKEKTFTIDNDYEELAIYISAGSTFSNFVLKPMLNSGDTALPYEPYFEGLRSTAVTEVKSVGGNLIPFPYTESTKTQNGVTFTVNDDGTIKVNGTASADGSFSFYNSSELRVNGTYTLSGITGGDSTGNSLYYYQLYVDRTSKIFNPNGSRTEQLSGTVTRIVLFYKMGTTFNNLTLKPMLNKGTTALPYTPYVEHTLPIPEAVQALDGYGWGVNDTVYNYIDWEKKQFVKRVGVVDMGTLNWAYEAHAQRFYADIPTMAVAGARSLDVLSDKFDADSDVVPGDNWKGFCYQKVVFVYSTEYTDAASFKSAMAGVMLVYELAEPIVTDISDLITSDNLIGVEGNGTLTFENEYGYDVPSTVEYITAESYE